MGLTFLRLEAPMRNVITLFFILYVRHCREPLIHRMHGTVRPGFLMVRHAQLMSQFPPPPHSSPPLAHRPLNTFPVSTCGEGLTQGLKTAFKGPS